MGVRVYARSRPRGSVSTLAASIAALVVLSQVLAAALYSISSSGRHLAEFASEMSRLSSIEIGATRLPNGSVKLTASAPVRVLATYLIGGGSVLRDYGGGVIDGELVLPPPASGGEKLLVVAEGGKFLVVQLEEPGSSGSSPAVLDLGYKLAIALLTNYASYLDYGPIHERVALSMPPTGADTGYKPILRGNVVFYFAGLTYGVPSGNHWQLDGERLLVYPNKAIASTGVSPNPAALTQVLKIVRGGGAIEVELEVSVELVNTTVSIYYPRILVVCYVVPATFGLQFPVAIFQPPAIGHEPWILRRVLYLAPPGQTALEYGSRLKLDNVPEGSYVLVGVEVLSYGTSTAMRTRVIAETATRY